MSTLERQLYRAIIRLHPASFRNQFGREMALDFDDALAHRGFTPLLADALLSLARQWSASLFPTPELQPATPNRPLLAGTYMQPYDEPMRPHELARGLIASTTLFTFCCFAVNASPRHALNLNAVYAASAPQPDKLQTSPAQPRLLRYYPSASPHSYAASAPQPDTSQTSTEQPELLLYHASAPLPSYEVATIKPLDPDTAGSMVKLPPGTFLSPLSIRRYIMNAYGATYAAQIIGGPDWLNKDSYNINGKVPDDIQTAFQKMTRDDRINKNRGMQQALLAVRFHLHAHFETRVLPVYEFVPAKGGLKITAVPAPPEPMPSDSPIRVSPGNPLALGTSMTTRSSTGLSVLNGRAIKISLLARTVGGDIGDRPIVDHTGFSGYFDITGLTWAPLGDSTTSTPDGPSLTSALEHDLGIKVVPTKAPIEVLVIDSIDRPSEN